MMPEPVTIFFDVNETLSDLSTVADAFDRVGAGRPMATTWFATVLRDGFALTSAGSDASFVDIAATNARLLLDGSPVRGRLDDAVEAVMTAFSSVVLHPEVAAGVRALRAGGHRIFTLSNGGTSTAERLLGDAGLLDQVDGLLSVEGHSPWKPARSAYLDALTRTATEGTAYLVAVHPWDVHGAAEAGLATAWINRQGSAYPDHFHAPTLSATGIDDLAQQLDRPAQS